MGVVSQFWSAARRDVGVGSALRVPDWTRNPAIPYTLFCVNRELLDRAARLRAHDRTQLCPRERDLVGARDESAPVLRVLEFEFLRPAQRAERLAEIGERLRGEVAPGVIG